MPLGHNSSHAFSARRVIAKPVNYSIPKWSVFRNKSCLYSRNHINGRTAKNHESTGKILQVEIVNGTNSLRVMRKTASKSGTPLGLYTRSTALPPSFWHSLANINWDIVTHAVDLVAIPLVNASFGCTIDGINTRPGEARGRQSADRRPIERSYGIFAQLREGFVVIDMVFPFEGNK